MEEHVLCHCCMHPSPVILCANPAAYGAGCQDGGVAGRGSPSVAVTDVTQDGGWEGGRGRKALEANIAFTMGGADRADGTRVSLVRF